MNKKDEHCYAKFPIPCHIDDTKPLSYNLTKDILIMTRGQALPAGFQKLNEQIEKNQRIVNVLFVILSI